jgi:hypothetical protein
MKISSLEQMETIVENNVSLDWDGWDVVEYQSSPTAWMKPNGVYRNNGWSLRKFYRLTSAGWDLPNKFVRKDEE